MSPPHGLLSPGRPGQDALVSSRRSCVREGRSHPSACAAFVPDMPRPSIGRSPFTPSTERNAASIGGGGLAHSAEASRGSGATPSVVQSPRAWNSARCARYGAIPRSWGECDSDFHLHTRTRSCSLEGTDGTQSTDATDSVPDDWAQAISAGAQRCALEGRWAIRTGYLG